MKRIEEILEELRAGQQKTLEALRSLRQEETSLEAIEEIRDGELEIIETLESIIENKGD